MNHKKQMMNSPIYKHNPYSTLVARAIVFIFPLPYKHTLNTMHI